MKGPIAGWAAFIFFCIAGITDYFDGYIARIRKEISRLGIFLDPIADKLLVASVILILTSKEVISGFEIIPALIILVREIIVSGLREFLARIKVGVPVSKIAKFKTALQLIALGILILSEGGITTIPVLIFGKIFLWIAAILTLYTGYDYFKSGIKHF
tara:strand:+ start:1237 stop:1710 length:474 start_codon:yes stop_codon:yes gene_type:complete